MTLMALIQFALSPVLAAEIPSDARAIEILKFCSVGEDGGIGYRREGNLSIADRGDFHAWFQRKNDPLASINELVSDDALRARAMVVASSVLDDDHFYRVSLNALQRFADGKASEKELKRILIPDPDKRGLLAVHFRDELLRSKLKKCLDRGISDPAYVNIANHILSGDGAKDVLRYSGNGFPQRYGPLAAYALGRPWLWLAGAVVLVLVAGFVLTRRF